MADDTEKWQELLEKYQKSSSQEDLSELFSELKNAHVKTTRSIKRINKSMTEFSEFATKIRLQVAEQKDLEIFVPKDSLESRTESLGEADLYDRISKNLLNLGEELVAIMEKRTEIEGFLQKYCNHDVA